MYALLPTSGRKHRTHFLVTGYVRLSIDTRASGLVSVGTQDVSPLSYIRCLYGKRGGAYVMCFET